MSKDLRKLLTIPNDRLAAINAVLLDPDERVITDFLAVVGKYGTPDEINKKHRESRKLDNLLNKVKRTNPDHLKDLFMAERTVCPETFYYGCRIQEQSAGKARSIDEICRLAGGYVGSLGAPIFPLDQTHG